MKLFGFTLKKFFCGEPIHRLVVKFAIFMIVIVFVSSCIYKLPEGQVENNHITAKKDEAKQITDGEYNEISFNSLPLINNRSTIKRKDDPDIYNKLKSISVDDFKSMLSNMGDINCIINNDGTLLHITIYMNRLDLVRELLDWKIDTNIFDSYGLPALHFATHYFRKDAIELLLDRSVSVNTRDKHGRTCIYQLCYRPDKGEGNRQIELMEFIFYRGANVNVQDILGMTPLHFAALHGIGEACEYLIAKGAKKHIRDYKNRRPIDIVAAPMSDSEVYFICNKYGYEFEPCRLDGYARDEMCKLLDD